MRDFPFSYKWGPKDDNDDTERLLRCTVHGGGGVTFQKFPPFFLFFPNPGSSLSSSCGRGSRFCIVSRNSTSLTSEDSSHLVSRPQLQLSESVLTAANESVGEKIRDFNARKAIYPYVINFKSVMGRRRVCLRFPDLEQEEKMGEQSGKAGGGRFKR
jgi:hypothetical protein